MPVTISTRRGKPMSCGFINLYDTRAHAARARRMKNKIALPSTARKKKSTAVLDRAHAPPRAARARAYICLASGIRVASSGPHSSGLRPFLADQKKGGCFGMSRLGRLPFSENGRHCVESDSSLSGTPSTAPICQPAAGLQQPIFNRWMHFKALLLRE